jgi:hypothetical protein
MSEPTGEEIAADIAAHKAWVATGRLGPMSHEEAMWILLVPACRAVLLLFNPLPHWDQEPRTADVAVPVGVPDL